MSKNPSCLGKYISDRLGITNTNKTNIFKNYYLKTVLSSVLASNGIINNSNLSLLPSMIISPIGTLILLLFHDLSIQNSFRNKTDIKIISRIKNTPYTIIISIIITLAVSFLYGFVYTKTIKKTKLPSKEMSDRISGKRIWQTFLISLVCAVALSQALKNDDILLIMSIGIATSLIPSLVNIGLNYGIHRADKFRMKHSLQNVINAKKFGIATFLINFITLSLGVSIYMHVSCINK